MVRIVLLLLLAHEGGGGAAVMAVGDVHGGHLGGEELDELVNEGAVVDDPETVAEAVFLGNEVIDRLLGGHRRHDFVDAGHGGVGEEDRLHVGVGDTHVFHAVLLLVLTGQLVFLDDFVDVVLAVGAGHDAVLPFRVGGSRVHALGVDVELLLLVLHQPAVILEAVVVFHHLEIHLEGVFVGADGQVDFGLGDVQQAVRVALALLAGLFGVQHVIRTGR